MENKITQASSCGSSTSSRGEIKPLIGFLATIKCHSVSHLIYLSRDKPKALAKIDIRPSIPRASGNRGMRLLCKTLQDSKGLKKIAIDATECSSQQFRALAKWLKTSRNIKNLELNIPLNPSKISKGVFETIFYLKDVKSLEYLDLSAWNGEREELRPPLHDDAPDFLHLRNLKKLQKLRIKTIKMMSKNIRNNMVLFLGIKGLSWLSELELDCSFSNLMPDREIQRFVSCLKEIKNLTSFKLNFCRCGKLGELFIDGLASYISSLQKLDTFYLQSMVYSNISAESIKKLIDSLGNKPALKTMVLLTPRPAFDLGQIQGLSIRTFRQLIALKLSLLSNSENINNNLLQDLTDTLRNNPRIETLDLKLELRPLDPQYFNVFCQSIESLINLTSFTFSLQDVLKSSNSEHVESLTRGIKTLKKLQYLHLNFISCALSSQSVAMLAESIDFLEDLETLYLDLRYPLIRILNYFSIFKKTTGLGSFGPVFQRHKSLSKVTLMITDMKPNSEEIAALASGVGSLKKLRKFVCDSCNLFCSDLKNLERSFARVITGLTNLRLEFKGVKHQDMESLFEILRGAKSLEKLDLTFVKVVSLSERSAENFVKMIKALVSLRFIKIQILAEKDMETGIISKFLDGMKYCHNPVDFSTRFNAQDHRKYSEITMQNYKYLKPPPSPIRYRSFY